MNYPLHPFSFCTVTVVEEEQQELVFEGIGSQQESEESNFCSVCCVLLLQHEASCFTSTIGIKTGSLDEQQDVFFGSNEEGISRSSLAIVITASPPEEV
ncbi:hypothetical protein GCM10020331_096730 [Ectobacillus funiculus]